MYNWKKDIVSWRVGKTLYLSVVFSWHLAKAEELARAHKGPVVAGGPAIGVNGVPWAETSLPLFHGYDVLSMHNPCATFTTRGCNRACKFCIVPKIEGDFYELPRWKPAPLVCDNNILAASRKHFSRVIQSLKHLPFVDFQGMNARDLRDWHLDLLTSLRSVKVRIAYDNIAQSTSVLSAVKRFRKAGIKNIGIYVLIGFNDNPTDAYLRLEAVRSWGILPNPMRYQPLNTTQKDAYVPTGWTRGEIKRMMRYYSRLIYLGHIPYEDYQERGDGTPDMLRFICP